MEANRVDLSNAEILIVDDDPTNLKVLRQALEREGYRILVATSGEQTLKIAPRACPGLILLDVMMPGMDGFETCRHLKQNRATREIPVIFITAKSGTEGIVEGFRAGGLDYITKPFQNEEVQVRVRTHLERTLTAKAFVEKNQELIRINAQLQEEIRSRQILHREKDQLADRLSLLSERESERWGLHGFVGSSSSLREILDSITRVQQSDSISVLITGESGTGKELIARAIHFGSGRSTAPFVPVNCASIPSDLAESLLFGHVRGAFTGATVDRAGYFEMAHAGTLFLDEIGDTPLDLQAKLLRVLEDGVITRIGATEGRQVDVRVLAATNADLQERIADGLFRQDLYYRLARFSVFAPPLRERPGDISLLAGHFLAMFAAEMGKTAPPLHPDSLERLEQHPFPGNVRELKNLVERALLESGGSEIRPEHLHFIRGRDFPAPPGSHPHQTEPQPESITAADLPLTMAEAEKMMIERALEQHKGNIAQAARQLGVNRSRIYGFLKNNPQT